MQIYIYIYLQICAVYIYIYMRMYKQMHACKCVCVCMSGFALTVVAGLHGRVYTSIKKDALHQNRILYQST